MVDCHGEKKQLNILTSVAHTMTKILYILVALAKLRLFRKMCQSKWETLCKTDKITDRQNII